MKTSKNVLKATVAAAIVASAFIGLLVCPLSNVNGQGVGINPSGNNPDPSAIIDASSTNKGALMPRMTTAQRDAISSPATGLQIYNTDCNNFNYYDGTKWIASNTNNSYIPVQPGAITGSASVCANSTGNTYSISPVSGAVSYLWTVPAGSTIASGQGTISITVTLGNVSGMISVTENNSCGTSNPSALAITINGAPATPGPISGFNTAVPGQSALITYAISPVPNASTYTWTIPLGATIMSGAGTASIIVKYNCNSVSGNVTVSATGTCGASSASSLAITVSPVVSASAGANVTIGIPACGSAIGGSPTASGGNSSSYTYLWSPATGLSNTAAANPIAAPTSTITYTVTVTDANGCTANSSMILSIGTINTLTLGYTGGQQSWTVPANISCVIIQAYGAGSGGKGGQVQTQLSVAPGSILYVYVGGSASGSTGGYNGGGNRGSGYAGGGGGGGGASDVRQGGSTLNDRVVVAGGGGGSGSAGQNSPGGGGGNGGYTAGTSGGSGSCIGDPAAGGGGGGTQSGGGSGGTVASGSGGGIVGATGTQTSGGAGGNCNGPGSYSGGGGGGGGGYYGGGGGGSGSNSYGCGGGGGGGGSSYAGTGTSNTTYTNGCSTCTGNGQVIISW